MIRNAVEGLEGRRLFAAFVVSTTADSGAGSLRDAITLANVDQTLDSIDFNIPGSGVQRIQPLTPLPGILSPVAINGYSQPGSQANTLAVGDDAKLLIGIHGDLGGVANSAGLHFTMDEPLPYEYRNSAGSSIRGLAINGSFDTGAIRVGSNNRGVDDITIAGNFIGTDAAGAVFDAGTSTDGIVLDNYARSANVGGLAVADRNVINGDTAISIIEGSRAATVVNNYIGLDATGTRTLGETRGISIEQSPENVIGGASVAARNVIGSDRAAIAIEGDLSGYIRIVGNYIGTAADGATRPVNAGTFGTGVQVAFDAHDVAVGGATAAEGNVIAHRSQGLNIVIDGDNVLVRHNSIFDCNTAIRLGSGGGSDIGVYNDPDDVDVGSNDGQNYAALISADAATTATRALAFLNSRPDTTYVVDFFASPNNGDPANGQAKTFLGSAVVKTDADGDATFTADLAAAPAGSYLTNTVTTLVEFPFGKTSRVSPAVEITGTEPPLPPVVLPKLSVGDVSVNEGNSGTKTLTFTVKLSAASTGAVSVLYATQDGTAKTGDNDYTAKNGTLTFAAGQTSKTVSVTIKGDTKSEIDESIKLLLSNASGATIADGSAVGTIKNDDAAPAKPKLSVGGYTTSEGHGGTKAFTFKVTLDKSGTGPITVKYNTQDAAAKAGSDYRSVSGTLTFVAGETSKTVTVYVKGDKTKESDEKFYLVLSSPTNATLAVNRGTGLVKNDD